MIVTALLCAPWHSLVPASVALAIGGVLLCATTRLALFAIGAAALALLFVGIHNAWDAVTHIVVTRTDGDATGAE